MSRLSRILQALALGGLAIGIARAETLDYAVAASAATQNDPAWRQVVAELARKRRAPVLIWTKEPEEILPKLRRLHPRWLCFIAKPKEAGREFIARIHRLTRGLDADPYTDCLWGVVTGYDAKAALRVARETRPLVVRKAAGGTEIDLSACEEGRWYSEVEPGLWVEKKRGGKPERKRGPADSTEAIVKTLNEYQPDLFVTSGHATEHDWQLGYSYRNGSFRHKNGKLYGLNLKGEKFPVRSFNPKVYLPVGNCLIGHIDGSDCMATAWMNTGGARQMFGYTVPTWYGYAGWGTLDCFLEQPGRFTFAEAFFANQHALVHRLARYFPELLQAELPSPGRLRGARVSLGKAAKAAGLRAQDGLGLLYDRDTVAFYGDPAWEARMASGALRWRQTLSRKGNRWELTIQPLAGARSFAPRNTNGSQRGGRPIIAFFPERVGPAKILEGAELEPTITDDFILVPQPDPKTLKPLYRVAFEATPLSASAPQGGKTETAQP
ncbi:MAG: hypothetical protein J7M29_03335 [Verrucomicrobia bacterium]|nr:hypothetical protein [Verrucomicrobiota bacterium]